MSHKLFAVLPIAASLSVVATFASISPAAAQAEPFLGQLMLTGATFCPRNWAQADGQLLSISQNTALFSLLRHDLWRQRPDHLRPARPSRPRADPPGDRAGPFQLCRGPGRRPRELHRHDQPDAGSQSRRAGDQRHRRQGRPGRPVSWRAASARRQSIPRWSAQPRHGRRHDPAQRGRPAGEPKGTLSHHDVVRCAARHLSIAQLTETAARGARAGR